MPSVFAKRKNRKAQAVAAGTTAAIAVVATGGISLVAAGVVTGVWWLTGKITEK